MSIADYSIGEDPGLLPSDLQGSAAYYPAPKRSKRRKSSRYIHPKKNKKRLKGLLFSVAGLIASVAAGKGIESIWDMCVQKPESKQAIEKHVYKETHVDHIIYISDGKGKMFPLQYSDIIRKMLGKKENTTSECISTHAMKNGYSNLPEKSHNKEE